MNGIIRHKTDYPLKVNHRWKPDALRVKSELTGWEYRPEKITTRIYMYFDITGPPPTPVYCEAVVKMDIRLVNSINVGKPEETIDVLGHVVLGGKATTCFMTFNVADLMTFFELEGVLATADGL